MEGGIIQLVDVLSSQALDWSKHYGLVGKMQLCVVFTGTGQLCLHLFDLYLQSSLKHVEIRCALECVEAYISLNQKKLM